MKSCCSDYYCTWGRQQFFVSEMDVLPNDTDNSSVMKCASVDYLMPSVQVKGTNKNANA